MNGRRTSRRTRVTVVTSRARAWTTRVVECAHEARDVRDERARSRRRRERERARGAKHEFARGEGKICVAREG